MNIISLLPSATEIICSIGLESNLVGVTHECDFPEFVQALPKVTRTSIPHDASSARIDAIVREQLKTSRSLYSLDMPTLESLKPDLIVTQALCEVCAVSDEEVRAALDRLPNNPQVVNLEPKTLNEVVDSINQVARVAEVEAQGKKAVEKLLARIDTVKSRTSTIKSRPRVALLEWLDPPFSCGHWNPELVRLAGGVEGFGVEGQPSKTLTWEEVIAWRPEVLFIACCGFEIERAMKDIPKICEIPGWDIMPAVQSGQVYVANGSHYFSRPGPRLVDSLEMLAHTLHPKSHPLAPCLGSLQRINTQRVFNQ